MEIEHKYDKNVEARLASIVVDIEYGVAKRNSNDAMADFDSYIDLFDAERSEKDYDWNSDIFIPEFPTHMLVQSADDVALMFRTRDFVETFATNKSQEALDAAEAVEDLLNTSLNRRELFHYHKYVRAKLINRIKGEVWAHCWWEQDVSRKKVGTDADEAGNEIPIYGYDIKKDYFNYEILDPRNVFVVDRKYAYSAQQKAAIIIRCERTYEDLVAEKKSHGYFNLEVVKDLRVSGQTETKRETRPDDAIPENKIDEHFDKLIRYGTFWMKGNAPGVDEEGEVIEGAVLKECVITYVVSGSTRVLIGFKEQTYKSATGQPYKPLIRGLCYIHPVNDDGVGDGKYASELQVAINDTFNLNNDRTYLATIPTLKARMDLIEDSDELYFEPGHVMPFSTDPDEIQEFRINDNIQGGLAQLGILTDKMRGVTATQPAEIGSVPELASTTATASATASAGSSRRANYQSMTFENTFLAEMYWMNVQMTAQFAKPETGFRLMGAKVFNFNPDYEFYFRPLSQSIETEYGKDNKINKLTTILQSVTGMGHPNAYKLADKLLINIFKLMGDEYEQYGGALLGPGQMQDTGGSQPAAQGQPVSNQNVIPMSLPEQGVRDASNG